MSDNESDGQIEKKQRKPFVMTDARKQAFEKCRAKRAEYCEQVRTAKKLGKLDEKEDMIKQTKEKIEAGEVKVPPITRPKRQPKPDSVVELVPAGLRSTAMPYELTEEQRQEALAQYMKNKKVSHLTKVEAPPSPEPPKPKTSRKKKTVVIEESSDSFDSSSESSVEVVVRKKSKAKPKPAPDEEPIQPVQPPKPNNVYTFL